MTSPCGSLALTLLFLIASPLPHSHLFTHAASTSPPVTRPRIIFMTSLGSDDDYNEDDYPDEDTPRLVKAIPSHRAPFLQGESEQCQYAPCLENQEPCSQMAARSGCLCPGLSGAEVPPHAPRLHALLPVTDGENTGKVEVQWCAPSSVVSGYRVVLEGNGGDAVEFGSAQRRGFVRSLEGGTLVCVEAVNSAGRSTAADNSCMRYDPPKSSDSNLLLWIIVGGVGLLLLIVVTSVILWKKKLCLKGKRESTDGLGNPSYSTEGTL